MFLQPIYGFGSGGDKAPLRFKRAAAAAAGHKDLYYIDDKDVNFKHVIAKLFCSHVNV